MIHLTPERNGLPPCKIKSVPYCMATIIGLRSGSHPKTSWDSGKCHRDITGQDDPSGANIEFSLQKRGAASAFELDRPCTSPFWDELVMAGNCSHTISDEPRLNGMHFWSHRHSCLEMTSEPEYQLRICSKWKVLVQKTACVERQT